MYKKSAIHNSHSRMKAGSEPYNMWLIFVIILLVGLGLVMIVSASTATAELQFNDPLYYFWKQAIAITIGLCIAIACLQIPVSVWNALSIPLLFLGLILLVLVIIPNVGTEVNGSSRWLYIGPLSIQASEYVKFFFIAYLAAYIVRHTEDVKNNFTGFIIPIGVLTIMSCLLLLEPDYGACVVLFATALGMLFLGGAPIKRLFLWLLLAISALAGLVVLSPYRMERLMSFSDPWQDPFSSGFQLTQALIAFGRGDWFGVGLGESVQKLFYLPEAHTDFLFSVFAEEFGFFGASLVIFLFLYLVWKTFDIAQAAEQKKHFFAAYLAYGIGLVIGLQVFINIGVNLGVLPTKGLPLPLMSYGGNNMVTTSLLLGILLRIDMENRQRT